MAFSFAEHDARAWPVFVSLPDYGDLCHKRECLFRNQPVSDKEKKKNNKKIEKAKNEDLKKPGRLLDFWSRFLIFYAIYVIQLGPLLPTDIPTYTTGHLWDKVEWREICAVIWPIASPAQIIPAQSHPFNI